MNTERMRWLLMLLVVLAAARYFLIPFIERQTEAVDRLALVTNRLDRSFGVVQNKDAIIESQGLLQQKTKPLRERFPRFADLSAGQLSTQEAINARLSAAGMRLVTFDWVASGKVEGAGLSFSRFQLQTAGEVKLLATFLGGLETEMPHLIVRDIALQPQQGFLRGPGPGNLVQVTISADVYLALSKRE